ncbi:hypothetical protein ONE63_000034 [Megalurothrips usitatus]|uniref:C2H2-type domain-containing protein n=1 Tax=Megalurothrips usitatus TaxID=439358 RepID=A0AAV7Y196_9NEOP|nr:hypothetical protein ONE63_000034 [Megalurothrips usitatus]
MKTCRPSAKQTDTSLDLNSSVNETISPSKLVTSTPFKAPVAPRSRARKAGSKKTFVNPVCATCSICGQDYRCLRSYKKHMRKHAIQDAASQFPDVQQILDHCAKEAFAVIERFSSLPAFAESGEKYKELLQGLQPDTVGALPEWNAFLNTVHEEVTKSIGDSKILLPSAMVDILIGNVEQLLCDLQQRSQLLKLLQACVQCDGSAAHCFVADYALALVKHVIKFFSDSLKNSSTSTSVGKDIEFDIEDKEAIHYISGSVVRAFYRKSQLFPRNAGWSRISVVIVQKLLESETVPGPPAIVKGLPKIKASCSLFVDCFLIFLLVQLRYLRK